MQAIFKNLVKSRGAPNAGSPGGEGTPFKSFSAGNLSDTFARLDPTLPANLAQPLFAVGVLPTAKTPSTSHPYLRASLMQKIFNNITTTSNVFAVWWTVGYFEVLDETVMPPRLGAEIGRNQNRQVRHRFFAIVDRSGMQLFNATSGGKAVAAGLGQTMNIKNSSVATVSGAATAWSAAQNYYIGNAVTYLNVDYICIQAHNPVGPPPILPTNTAYWLPMLQPGMLLEISPGTPTAEVVSVISVTANKRGFVANFTQAHPAGTPIICRGNPGPQTNYNPRKDANVVLHMSVIK